MKKFPLFKWPAIGLLALLLLALCPSRASAMVVSGPINASEITDEYIQLNGATTITVDCDKYLRRIQGQHCELTIIFDGNGHTLTVDDGNTAAQNWAMIGAIGAKKLTVQGNGTLVASSLSYGIEADEITFTDTKVHAEGRNFDYSEGIHVKKSIDVYNSNVTATGKFFGIRMTEQGCKLTMHSGKLQAIGRGFDGGTSGWGNPGGWGICTGSYYLGTVDVQGGELIATSTYCGAIVAYRVNVSGGKLTATSSLGGASHTIDDQGAIHCHMLNVSGGEVYATSNRDGIHVMALMNATGGKVTGDGGKNNHSGIYATGSMNFSGESEVTGNGSDYGIYCEDTITINNKHTMGITRANGFTYGIYSKKKIIFPMGDDFEYCEAYSKEFKPFEAVQGMEFLRPWMNDAGFTLYVDGNCFENNGSVGHGHIGITRPDITYWTSPPNARLGWCTDYTYAPTDVVTLQVPQALTDFVNYPDAVLTVQWWGNTPEDPENYYVKGTSVVTGNQAATYTAKTVDDGTLMYALLSYDTHNNWAYSRAFSIQKAENNLTPVKAELLFRYSNLWVKNAKTDQEYLVLTTKKEIADLTESDWAAAERPTTAGNVQLSSAVSGNVCYVYTRYKSTARLKPGNVVLLSEAYNGNTGNIQDIELQLTGVGFDILPDANGEVLVPHKNAVIKCDLVPVPDNVEGFIGIPEYAWWFTNCNMTLGTVYSDANCTQALDFNASEETARHFKTVYIKVTQTTTQAPYNISAYYSSIFPGTNKKSSYNINVANDDGTYNMLYAIASNGYTNSGDLEALFVPGGSELSQPIYYRPLAASLNNVTTEFFSTYGTLPPESDLPVLTIDAEHGMLLVDATNCPADLRVRYRFKSPYRNLGAAQIVVTAPVPTGITVTPNEITLDPLDTEYQLTATIKPANAVTNESIVWSSSNTNLATVDENGLVTMVEASDINDVLGETVTITATLGDLSASCDIHISGEKYPLWINGTQVTSMNKDNVLGNGKVSYEAGKLTLNGFASSKATALECEMPALTIHVKGTNTVVTPSSANSSGMVYMPNTNVQFMGNGSLGLSSSSKYMINGIYANNIAVTDTVAIEATGQNYGVRAKGMLSVYNETASVRGKGATIASLAGKLGITGNVVEPNGAAINYVSSLSGYAVTNASGSPVMTWAKLNGVEAPEEFLRGDVNGDGDVNVIDITALIDAIMNDDTSNPRADVNEDGEINVIDITALIDIIMNS